MSGTDNQNDADSDDDEFNLADFIDDKSSLFGVMGVFVAVSAYLSQVNPGPITDAEMMIKSGFIASLGLALLMLILIYSSMKSEFGAWSDLYRAHIQFSNWPLTLFTGLTAILLLSVTHVITLDEPVVFLLIITGTTVIGLMAFTKAVHTIGQIVPRTPVWRISTMFFACGTALTLSILARTQYLNQFELTTIRELTFADPVTIMVMLTIVFVTTIQSLASVGLIATFIGIPIVAIDKIRGKSPYDNPE